jgi:hypothetical protein
MTETIPAAIPCDSDTGGLDLIATDNNRILMWILLGEMRGGFILSQGWL